MLSVRKDGQVGHLQSNSIPRASSLTCFPDLDTKWQRSREHLTERGTIRGLILHLQLAMTPREQVYRDENSTADTDQEISLQDLDEKGGGHDWFDQVRCVETGADWHSSARCEKR